MIKRFVVTMILALGVLSLSHADIKMKDLGNGKVAITFLFKDSSSEMGAIGSFNNWTVPGVPMTKNGDGLWEVTVEALATDEIAYKFYSKGTWIFDDMAPDKKDDGFGGFNGLIVVADILSGVTPITPVKAAAKDSGDAAAAGPKVVTSKLNFGMYTIVGSKSTFSTQGVVDKTEKGLETDTTGLYAKSYWKVGGTIVPNVNVWWEMKAFDGYQQVWAQDSRGIISPKLNEGLTNLVGGLVTNPINTLNGGNNPVLNSVKTGIETPLIFWETGYGYAKPSKRTALLWETLGERDGNNGYMRFDLGSDLKKIGDLNIEAAVIPNVLTGNYGVLGWFDASFKGVKVDLQYDAKSAESPSTGKLSRVFDKLYHQDFLGGIRTKVDVIEVTAQGLINQFSETDFDVKKNVAAEVKATWALPNDVLGSALGYRYTGEGSEMIFGNNGDALGDKGKQRVLFNVYGKPISAFKVGADTTATVTTASLSDSAIELYAKPYLEYDLKAAFGKASSLNAYAKAKYNLLADFEYASSQSALQFGEAGAKFTLADPIKGVVNGADVYYGLNNWDDNKVFQTAIVNLTLPKDTTVQTGFGMRTVRDTATDAVKDANNLMAFSLGASVKINDPAIKTPLFYTAFVYNMDPYDDGTNNLKFSDYTTDGGVSKNDGKAILRVMMKWDF